MFWGRVVNLVIIVIQEKDSRLEEYSGMPEDPASG